MSLLHTCGLCKNLKRTRMANIYLYSCKLTGFCVPQTSEDGGKTVFTRVPLECPLPTMEASKSAKPAARREWVRLTAKPSAPL
jgi:hypothetical protein